MAEPSVLRRVWTRIVSLFYEPPPDEGPEAVPASRDAVPEATRLLPPHMSEKTGPLPVFRQQRADYGGMPVVLARPRNMEDATAVAERVKDRVPVIMNLEGVDQDMARRLVDFIGGVVFALDGSLRKSGRAVYVCTPFDIPLEELRIAQPARRASLFDVQVEEAQQIAL